jgi:hypothetical protein
MKEILDAQVDSYEEQDIKIMSQVYLPKVWYVVHYYQTINK